MLIKSQTKLKHYNVFTTGWITFRIRLREVSYFAAVLICIADRRDHSVSCHVRDAPDNPVFRREILQKKVTYVQT